MLTSDKVRRVGAESAVPNPALMTSQDLLELELPVTADGPDFDCRVCGTGR